MLLSLLAARLALPYPALLAAGGAGLALVPGVPVLAVPPDLVLALFVAPILLDAAFDTSLRDLRANWAPVAGLVLGAVLVTTAAVAIVVRAIRPDLPWPAAIALGAVVAPPDAAAAAAILRNSPLPRRLKVILESESLLNDASALIILRLAVAAAASGFTAGGAATALALALASLAVGPAVAVVYHRLLGRVRDVPSAVLFQFIGTFGVWILAERLHLSAILTVVAYGITLGRLAPERTPARLRVPAYAVWDTATFSVSVLAFALIGLQVRPILERATGGSRDLALAAAVLATVIAARFTWVMSVIAIRRWREAEGSALPPTWAGGLAASWAGMRGVVTVAAALSLSPAFPGRDAVVLAAFAVVLGTLLLQGCTLGFLLRRRGPADDGEAARELADARRAAFEAALARIDGDNTPAAKALRQEYRERLEDGDADGSAPRLDALQGETVRAAREALSKLRRAGTIGDDAYHAVEEELDWMELSAGSARSVA